jgi:hypothetical protein
MVGDARLLSSIAEPFNRGSRRPQPPRSTRRVRINAKDRDEGPARASALVVERASDELLTGAALRVDEVDERP